MHDLVKDINDYLRGYFHFDVFMRPERSVWITQWKSIILAVLEQAWALACDVIAHPYLNVGNLKNGWVCCCGMFYKNAHRHHKKFKFSLFPLKEWSLQRMDHPDLKEKLAECPAQTHLFGTFQTPLSWRPSYYRVGKVNVTWRKMLFQPCFCIKCQSKQ